jgi:small subunit ribosomal protein S20
MTSGEDMPQRRTAIKDLRKAHTKHLHNLQIKTDLKKTVKKFMTAASGKKADAQEILKEVYKKFDKAAKRNVMHKKTAARRKSRFARSLISAAKQ